MASVQNGTPQPYPPFWGAVAVLMLEIANMLNTLLPLIRWGVITFIQNTGGNSSEKEPTKGSDKPNS